MANYQVCPMNKVGKEFESPVCLFIKLHWYKTMNNINDVSFKYNGIPGLAHPLAVTVEDRLLSLAADNNLRSVGADYTRTYLRLYDKLNKSNEEIILDTYAVTPQMLLDAMQWVVTGDITFILKYV